MPKFSEVPHFTKGEPGFAGKLNELGAVLREVIAALEEQPAAPAPKAAPRRAAKSE